MLWKLFPLLLLIVLTANAYNVGRVKALQEFDTGQLLDDASEDASHEDDIDMSSSTTQRWGTSHATCSEAEERPCVFMGAANIAAKAAQVATAANNAQSNAAECAAKQVKIQLAEKAIQASKAVQAVLACKRALVDKLQTEMKEADALSTHLGKTIQLSEGYGQKVACTAKSAESQLTRLLEMEDMLHQSLTDMSSLGELSQLEFNDKRQMLIIAKERGDRLQKQVECVRNEYEQVKVAAYQAACAAVEARQKANSTADRNYRNLIRRRRGKCHLCE